MTELHCDRLDDYLDGDLLDEERIQFQRHLCDCHKCRDAVHHWQSSRQQLKSVVQRLENPSKRLQERIEWDAIVAFRQSNASRQQRFAVLITASVVMLAAVGFWAMQKKEIELVRANPIEETKPEPMNSPPAITLSFPDDVIGVPIDIGDPNVTVVWLYLAHTNENETN